MPYCPRCGVEVEDRLDSCPLCDTVIPDEVRSRKQNNASYPADMVRPRKMYKSLTPKQRRGLIFSLIILIGLMPVLLTSVLDFIQNGLITWSYYVTFSIIGAAGISSLYIRFPRKPMVSVNGTILLSVLWYMLMTKQSPQVFIVSGDFPVILTTAVTTESILIFLSTAQRRWFNIVSYSLFILTLFLIILEFLLSKSIKWSFITSSILIPSSVYFFYIGKVKNKGLNTIGVFFFLLTLMLLALDFSTDYSGWSLITSVILGFLSLVFYIMHIALFNDTDWKKALHL